MGASGYFDMDAAVEMALRQHGGPYTVRSDPVTTSALAVSVNTKPIDPARMTLDDAKALAALPAGLADELKINRRLYYGDHWLDGQGYKGPWPMPGEGTTPADHAGILELQVEIVRGFTSVNALAECGDRHVNGVIGTEPRWTWTPDGVRVRTTAQRRPPLAPMPVKPDVAPDPNGGPAPTPPVPAPAPAPTPTADAATDERVAELNALATTWWDEHDAPSVFQDFVISLLYGRVGTFRLYVPPSMMTPETASGGAPTGRMVLRVKDVKDALRKIHVEVVDGDAGRVVKERHTLTDVGIRFAMRRDTEIAHVTYLDASGRTVLAVIDKATARSDGGETTVPAASASFDLGGRLLMHSAMRNPFVTPQARESQFALNFANSMIPRNVATAGFLTDIWTNTHVPGHWEETNGQRRYVPDPILRGPGVVTVLQGHELEDSHGAKTMTTPVVHERQPVDPTPTIKAKREHYEDILHACDQLHILITGDAVTSGVSRQQARADFLASLRHTKARVDRAGRWLLETVLAWAYALASPSGAIGGQLDGFRVSFNCTLDAGPIDAAERAQNTADVGAGTLSVETAIERNSIVDVDAELERIDAVNAADLEIKRATIFGSWVTAGADEAFAAWRAGLSAAEIERLSTTFTPPAPPPGPGDGTADGGTSTPPSNGNGTSRNGRNTQAKPPSASGGRPNARRGPARGTPAPRGA